MRHPLDRIAKKERDKIEKETGKKRPRIFPPKSPTVVAEVTEIPKQQ